MTTLSTANALRSKFKKNFFLNLWKQGGWKKNGSQKTITVFSIFYLFTCAILFLTRYIKNQELFTALQNNPHAFFQKIAALLSGVMIHVALVGILSFVCFYILLPIQARKHRKLTLYGTLLVLGVALHYIFTIFIPNLQPFANQKITLVFFSPLAVIGILGGLFIGLRFAILLTITLFLTVSITPGWTLQHFLGLFFGALMGVILTRNCGKRRYLFRAGAAMALIQISFFAAWRIIPFSSHDSSFISSSLSSILLCLFVVPLTVGALYPALEKIFGFITNFTLADLAMQDHPLLKEMRMVATGTFHHTLEVSNLAEAAAEILHANSLLTRVGAYYHDIGKMIKPEYFTENQFSGIANPHDLIKPSLSASILKAHVTEGVALAKKYHLPPRLHDFILEHHGTTMMMSFYYKALEKAEANGVSKQDFQYPGPKPQSVETAIVMLADSCSSAVRSLPKKSLERIREMVHKIIRGRLLEGQLDDTPLSLRELRSIADSFIFILSGFYHTRIEYPEEKEIKAAEKTKKKEG